MKLILGVIMKTNLSKDDILNKKFKVSHKGYDMKEVDSYLDLIISDYDSIDSINEEYDKKIKELENRIIELNNEIKLLKEENELKSLSFVKDNENIDVSKIDNLYLLKRCSKYEKKLYSMGVNPSKIK